MSDTRERVYNFIVEFQAKHGTSPTLDEIAQGLELGKSTVAYHIKEDARLTRRGFRWIEIVEPAQQGEEEAG